MAYNFKGTAKAAAPTSITTGKVKFSTDDILTNYPGGITLTGFDIANGRNGDFAICTFAENDKAYFYAGKAITRICKSWHADFEGDTAECNKQLAASGGVKLKMRRKTLEDGRDFIAVTVE